VPARGLAPGAKIGVADAAYARSSLGDSVPLYLPTALPDDGANLEVRISRHVAVPSDFEAKGAALKDTHKVQSVRGKVEHTIRKIKEYAILQGSDIQNVAVLEKIMDNACAEHNLKTLFNQNHAGKIPKKGKYAPDAHIMTPDLEPSVKIPQVLDLRSPKVVPHVKQFHEALTSIVPFLEKALARGGERVTFQPRVLTRGENLLDGCQILQVRFQHEGDGLWTLLFYCGASWKSPVYKCYVQIKLGVGVLQNVCDCKHG
jgi:hypothetical protein